MPSHIFRGGSTVTGTPYIRRETLASGTLIEYRSNQRRKKMRRAKKLADRYENSRDLGHPSSLRRVLRYIGRNLLFLEATRKISRTQLRTRRYVFNARVLFSYDLVDVFLFGLIHLILLS